MIILSQLAHLQSLLVMNSKRCYCLNNDLPFLILFPQRFQGVKSNWSTSGLRYRTHWKFHFKPPSIFPFSSNLILKSSIPSIYGFQENPFSSYHHLHYLNSPNSVFRPKLWSLCSKILWERSQYKLPFLDSYFTQPLLWITKLRYCLQRWKPNYQNFRRWLYYQRHFLQKPFFSFEKCCGWRWELHNSSS